MYNEAKITEKLVLNVMKSRTNDYEFEHLLDQEEWGHYGDIRATNKKTGEQFFIEVKEDNVIHRTNNVLCEYRKYFFDTATFKPGNMTYNYQFYCVLDQISRKIYVIDFNILRRIYQMGYPVEIEYYNEITFAYKLSLDIPRRYGAILHTIDY